MRWIGIVGTRRRDTLDDYNAMVDVFHDIYQSGDRLVSGGCPKGGDRFAEDLARTLGLTILIHHADWSRKGKIAGFQRNTLIAQDCDVLIAVVSADRTGGTEDTINKAVALGKLVFIV